MVEKSIPDMSPSSRRIPRILSGDAARHGTNAVHDAPVWVIENTPLDRVGPALALGRRLGLTFRRIRKMLHLAAAEEEAIRTGMPPALVVSSGLSAGWHALGVRARYGSRLVHCATGGGGLPALGNGYPFDMLVVPRKRFRRGRVIGTLGPMCGLSPALLAEARRLWEERLLHLPYPRVVFLFGGEARTLTPDRVQERACQVSAMVRARGGSILACVLAGTDSETGQAFASALSSVLHLVWHHGEPDENPMLGFIGCSDAIVTMGVDDEVLIEAAGADKPVFLADEGRGGWLGHDLSRLLLEGDYVRPLENGFSPWSRAFLDEAGRVAAEINRAMSISS